MGASGYAGSEVVRLCSAHPDLEVVSVTGETSAGRPLGSVVPGLAAVPAASLELEPSEAVLSAEADVVFLALPHGQSQRWVPMLLERAMVVDLGADYRLKDAALYDTWYHEPHGSPELLERAVYGLVERHRGELPGARLIASPGCYPTATSLALGPFVDRGLVEGTGIVVNALSGASGAGRALSDRLHFSRLSANAEAYGLVTHRHTPEIEQEIGAEVLFTPHLVPASRGMLVTACARVADSSLSSSEAALEVLRSRYADDPFVVVSAEPPTLKDPVGSNLCFVSARVDPRTGWLVAMSSLDNLIKGAAGQAVQAWNVATGRPETLGLPLTGVTP